MLYRMTEAETDADLACINFDALRPALLALAVQPILKTFSINHLCVHLVTYLSLCVPDESQQQH